MSDNINRKIGKCIYCGSIKDLTDEHIIPHGLGGPWQLLNASCKECNKITSFIERDVLKGCFLVARTKLGLPTYHHQNRPKSFKVKFKSNGNEEVKDISVSDIPLALIMLEFPKPGCLTGENISGMKVTATSIRIITPDKETMKIVNQMRITSNFTTSFPRLIAKIAYCMAVLKYGYEAICESEIVPSILGLKDNIGYWVGCEHEGIPESLPKEPFLHSVTIIENNNRISAKVRLFANLITPEYLVELGRLKK